MKSIHKKMLVATAAMALAGVAQAQSAGSNIISLGWFRVMPNSSADPLTVDSINGRPLGLVKQGTGADIESADTVGLAFTHFFTDNISGEFVAGIPPKHDVKGDGTFAKYGKLGSVKQWSPALLVKYHFFDAKTKFRPYIGIGVNYTWFSDETISNQTFVNNEFGPGERQRQELVEPGVQHRRQLRDHGQLVRRPVGVVPAAVDDRRVHDGQWPGDDQVAHQDQDRSGRDVPERRLSLLSVQRVAWM